MAVRKRAPQKPTEKTPARKKPVTRKNRTQVPKSKGADAGGLKASSQKMKRSKPALRVVSRDDVVITVERTKVASKRASDQLNSDGATVIPLPGSE